MYSWHLLLFSLLPKYINNKYGRHKSDDFSLTSIRRVQISLGWVQIGLGWAVTKSCLEITLGHIVMVWIVYSVFPPISIEIH